MVLKRNIIYEDECMIAVNKAPYQEDKSLLDNKLLLDTHLLYPLHPLASGILIFKKQNEPSSYCHSIKNTTLQYHYLLLVQNSIPDDNLHITTSKAQEYNRKRKKQSQKHDIKDLNTRINIIERFTNYTYLSIDTMHYQTDAIRRYYHSIGHPVVADHRYHNPYPIILSQLKPHYKINNVTEERPLLNRLGIHLEQVHYHYPQQRIIIKAPLPKDIKATLQQLRKHNTLSNYMLP